MSLVEEELRNTKMEVSDGMIFVLHCTYSSSLLLMFIVGSREGQTYRTCTQYSKDGALLLQDIED